jgi:hypothetical protein
VSAALVVYPAAAGDRLVQFVAGLGIAGWALLALALAGRWPALVAWGIAGLGAEYALFLRLRGETVDVRAPVVAAGLIVAAELAFRAVEPEEGRLEGRLVVRSATAVAAAAAATALIGGVLLVAAGSFGSGLALEAAGVAAAVVAVGLVVRIAARR